MAVNLIGHMMQSFQEGNSKVYPVLNLRLRVGQVRCETEV